MEEPIRTEDLEPRSKTEIKFNKGEYFKLLGATGVQEEGPFILSTDGEFMVRFTNPNDSPVHVKIFEDYWAKDK